MQLFDAVMIESFTIDSDWKAGVRGDHSPSENGSLILDQRPVLGSRLFWQAGGYRRRPQKTDIAFYVQNITCTFRATRGDPFADSLDGPPAPPHGRRPTVAAEHLSGETGFAFATMLCLRSERRTMRAVAALFCVVTGLAACATSTPGLWQKPGADSQAVARDNSECRAAARQEAVRRYPFTANYPSLGAAGVVMSQQQDDIDRSSTENSVFNTCMRQRGYKREPAS